ncbi:nitrilotriacetate monooxygenase [Streptomyces lincolnensis]|uniref:Nitrilotriacetate monooxygenase n=1 Tax=Streptomyces lincolnensis TaxID=1915 RepID=A0A1B1M2I9_STRLN|nr:NtaA/DmoA family FMN-dependent monooxygenase [Streptomyces lincolnensis]ANS62865.1 nitrilotriacetate monooxygenase [Streptomyces lincolnensis]AXG51789.1 nitrilotriacetate monooxygenase [Streptomyces lincolnensis]QMV04801.1 NtaA/DmoA family FMN-dependent monooxygenase [Streptomyces lincolnensis]
MTSRQMTLGMQFSGGYGAAPGAWRLPGANLNSYTDMDQFVRYAQAAERGKIQLLFIADTPVLDVDLDRHAPHHMIDPLLILTVLARETERIGLVTTASTTFTEPYNLARQFKALDVISHGRAGWNAVTTSDPAAAANFGATIPPRAEKYERAHEVIQIVQALWGSWEKDAWLLDVDGKRFADMDKIQPVNLQGKHVASRGPLPIPPSEQGQPVIFQAGGGSYGLELAGRHASGVYANPYTIEDARAQRQALRDAAKRAGRDPDEVKMLAGFMPTIAPSRQAALQRRRFLDEVVDLDQRVRYLGAMIGLSLGPGRLDEPLTADQLADAIPSPHDPRSTRALEVAREGWPLRDVLAHGVIDYHPVVAGTAADVADHMQQWFEAGACDGFSIAVDSYHDGFDTFVDQVVPILQERGLFHDDYEGPTLRENLGAHKQYGLDPRLTKPARS